MNRFLRNENLIGKGGQTRLSQSNVLIVGVGGVGGYVAEMLARSGVGRFTVIDPDVVDITNINRQIIALDSTLGLAKVDVIKARIADINPSCEVTALKERYCSEISDKIFKTRYDYCVDAIDSVKDKVDLIVACKRHNLRCISALGAGNRLECNFEVKDIFSTSGDGLARSVRSKLRKEGIDSHKCICSVDPPLHSSVPPSSISYVPAVMGCQIAREVIGDLLCR